MPSAAPRVAIFGPNPLLTRHDRARGEERDDVHFHAGGQGVWVARMAGELGACPVLCGFAGGETGACSGRCSTRCRASCGSSTPPRPAAAT